MRHDAIPDSGELIWNEAVGGMCVSHTLQGDYAFNIEFSECVSFCASFENRSVQWRTIDEATSEETVEHFFYDQLLPRLIAHDGALVLHAGGIAFDDRAIAIMAPTGHGKSTLSASLQSAGHTLLGDDALIVGANTPPTVRAVYPSLRLLPDSVEHLFGDTAQTRTMAHYSAKRHVSVEGSDATVPLGMLIFLDPPAPDIALRRLSVAEACMSLIANSFALDPTDKTWATANMRRASALANTVPAYALSYPRDYAALPDVHAAITETLSTIGDIS